jgi:LysM repeat protein
LLTNPGFEEPFITDGGDEVANGWNAWHVPRAEDEPNFQNEEPDYFQAVREDRIRSGSAAQRYESFFATHTGGVFQVVPDVGEGSEVTFGVYAWVWSSSLDNEDVSEDDGDVILDVGIDPTGGTDGTSPDIIWSVGEEQYDSYNLYTVDAIAEADTISVWVRSRVGFAVKTSRIYLDDAFLTIEREAPPTDTPTTTPTATTVVTNPSPTPDVVVTVTEAPTSTPVPDPTATQPPISETFPNTITHTVQRGDTVSRLATLYNSSIDAIQQANGLTAGSLIFVGQELVIPVPAAATPTATPLVIVVTATPSDGDIVGNTYVVQPGDTLSSIARRTNSTVAAIAQLNGIVNPNRIFTGQRLVVPVSSIPTATPVPVITATPIPAATATPVPPSPRVYIVQPGDNLYRVSLRFGVPVSALIRANGIVNANRIFAGQQLIIP